VSPPAGRKPEWTLFDFNTGVSAVATIVGTGTIAPFEVPLVLPRQSEKSRK